MRLQRTRKTRRWVEENMKNSRRRRRRKRRGWSGGSDGMERWRDDNGLKLRSISGDWVVLVEEQPSYWLSGRTNYCRVTSSTAAASALTHFVLMQRLKKLLLAAFVLQDEQKLFHTTTKEVILTSRQEHLKVSPSMQDNLLFFFLSVEFFQSMSSPKSLHTLKLRCCFFHFCSASTYFDILLCGDVKLSERQRRRSGN